MVVAQRSEGGEFEGRLREALGRLARINARQASIMELRLGGLSSKDVGRALSLPLRIVEREYYVARLWLLKEVEDRTETGS